MPIIHHIHRTLTPSLLNSNFHLHISTQLCQALLPIYSHHHFTLHSTTISLLFYNNLSKTKKTYQFLRLLFKYARMPFNAARTPPIPALSYSNSPLVSHTTRLTAYNSPLSSSLTIGPPKPWNSSQTLTPRNSNLLSYFQFFFLLLVPTSKTKPHWSRSNCLPRGNIDFSIYTFFSNLPRQKTCRPLVWFQNNTKVKSTKTEIQLQSNIYR